MNNGFLYIANKQKFVDESLISVRSLKRFNNEPVCLVCTEELITPELSNIFDQIITLDAIENLIYVAKIYGMQVSPFERTIYLDCDTFITDNLAEMFSVLDLVDFAAVAEPTLHTTTLTNLKYVNVFPEFQAGVIAFKKNVAMEYFLEDWLAMCVEKKTGNDMPILREAALKHIEKVRFLTLPNQYNTIGFSSMVMLYTKVKVIHARLGYKPGIITPHFSRFEEMDRFAKMINKREGKRLYIARVGVIPYNWNLLSIILKFKKMLGYKRISKNK